MKDTTIRARMLRHNQTDGENKLWYFLKNRNLGGYKFRRQHLVGPYFADFYCAEAGIVVEVDGSQHTGQMEKDARRTRFLEDRGLRVVRFWADQVVRETEAVLDTILNELRKPSPQSSP